MMSVLLMIIVQSVFMLIVVHAKCHLCLASLMLSVIYDECDYGEGKYAECRYA
jgi:hypothetical protein